MERKKCPYCGEEIAATAKKCRFCGEWLETPSNILEKPTTPIAYAEAVAVADPVEISTSDGGNLPSMTQDQPGTTVNPNTPTASTNQPNIIPGTTPGQTVMSVGGQPIVLNIQQHQNVEQRVEQTVVVAGSGSSDNAPGWIFAEMWCLAAGLGLALQSWWWFLGIGLGGSMLLMVPYIGAVMCVLIGLAWGLLAGAIGAALFSTSAGWVIGILVSMGAIYGHLEARKQNMEEE